MVAGSQIGPDRFGVLVVEEDLSSSFVALVEQRETLPARHRSTVLSGDSLHFGPVSRFLVARVAKNHTVLIEGVQVSFLSLVPGHRPPRKRTSGEGMVPLL